MASSDARPFPIKNTAFRAVFPILNNTGSLVTGAAGLDSEVSKDQGTFADCTNEATEIATASGIYYLDLTSTEMNADCVAVIVKTSTTDAKTTTLIFYPAESTDIPVNVTGWNGTAVATPDTAGYPKVTIKDGTGTGEIDLTSGGVLVSAIAANAVTASALATDAVAEIADGVWDEATAGHVAAGSFGAAVGDILTDTAVIGAAGAGLTAIPWNAAWDAEVQSEVTDALVAYDPPTKAELDSAVAPLALEATLGTPAGASISADIAVIESQTDDIGVAGAGLTAIPWNASWDAEVQSEVVDGLTAFWTSPATLVDLVWDEPTAGHTTAGTTGKALIDAGSAGDPWSTALPGAYGAGTAGQIIGDNLNATVSSRATQTSVDDLPTNAELATALDALPTAAENADAVWDEAAVGHVGAGTYGLAVSDILVDTAQIGAAGAGLSAIPWNAAWDAEVQSEVTDALVAYDPPTEAEMNARTIVSANYATASALQVVDDEVAALQTSINDVPTVAEFEARTIVAANYATASALATVDTEVGVIDGIVDAIKLKTDLIPAAPAAVGDIPTAVQNADALLGRTISGGANGGRDVTSALRQLRNKQVIAAGTLTVYQEDDTTSAWTAAITTAAGDPITEMDPA